VEGGKKSTLEKRDWGKDWGGGRRTSGKKAVAWGENVGGKGGESVRRTGGEYNKQKKRKH